MDSGVWDCHWTEIRSRVEMGADIDELYFSPWSEASTLFRAFAGNGPGTEYNMIAATSFEHGANIWWEMKPRHPDVLERKETLRLILSWRRVCEDVGRMIADMCA